MITKDDWINYLKTIQGEPDNQKTFKMLQYGSQNYDQLSPDVKTIIDNLFDSAEQIFIKAMASLPEGKEKRQCQRSHDRIKNRRFYVKHLLQSFEKPPALDISILEKSRKVFVDRLQNALDFMLDVTKKTHKGEAEFAKLGLISLCINELLCARHLIEHHYITQAYAHIRTTNEILDKIELFHQKPEWAKLWASNDEKSILHELSPAAVREKLGNPRYDPIYSMFSSLGPHGTFKSVQTTSWSNIKPSEKGNTCITLCIGGVQRQRI